MNTKPDNIGQMMIDTTRSNPIETDRLKEAGREHSKDAESSLQEPSISARGTRQAM